MKNVDNTDFENFLKEQIRRNPDGGRMTHVQLPDIGEFTRWLNAQMTTPETKRWKLAIQVSMSSPHLSESLRHTLQLFHSTLSVH